MREPLGFHVTMALEDRRTIAIGAAAFRAIACVLLGQGAMHGLIAYGVADTHLHALLMATRASAGAFAQRVQLALGRRLRLGAGFVRAHFTPLRDQGHAYNAFYYVQRQDRRHGLDRDPFREGTSLPDHLRIRFVEPQQGPTIASRALAHLPRIDWANVIEQFAPASFADRPIDPAVLPEAAAAAFALPSLRGRGPRVACARQAVVHLAGADASSSALGASLGVGARAIQLMRAEPCDARVVRAVRLQALLRTPAAGQPTLATAEAFSRFTL